MSNLIRQNSSVGCRPRGEALDK